MNGFLFDTNIPSELTRQKTDPNVEGWLNNANDASLFLRVVSVGEIVNGITVIPVSKRRADLQQWLDRTLLPWFGWRILPVTEPVAVRWGLLAGHSRLLGREIKIADGLIAATAPHHDLTIVTRNVRDFSGFGLSILNPWQAV